MNINIFLLNWRRRENLYKIINAIKAQTMIPNIVVIDNASTDINHSFSYPDENITVIQKNNENMCWERWLAALNFPNKYICVMDDDIIFSKSTVIESCYNYMESNNKVDAIGAYGVKYSKQFTYFGSEHTYCKHKDVQVPILKGRFMFVRFDSIRELNKDAEPTCDDIKISSILKTKILPACLLDSFIDLPQANEAISAKHYQNTKREYAVRKYFR